MARHFAAAGRATDAPSVIPSRFAAVWHACKTCSTILMIFEEDPWMKILLALIAALTVASCATSQSAQGPTLYQRLGGRAAITAIVDDAIVNVSADPRINQRFANVGPGEV